MKRLTAFITSVFSLAVLAISPVLAGSHTWTLNVFQPTDTIVGREVAIEYKVVSTDPNDEFGITLLQNGVQTNTQNITNDYGSPGTFTVTVPAAGSYDFTVTAQELESSETQSQTRTVSFADAPQPTISTVYRTVSSSQSSGGTTSGNGTANNGGVVSDAAATVTKESANALGAATKDGTGTGDQQLTKKDPAQSDDDNQTWLWAIAAGLLAAGSYYRFVYSQGKGPFVQK